MLNFILVQFCSVAVVEINFFSSLIVKYVYVTERKANSLYVYHAICLYITTVEVRVRVDIILFCHPKFHNFECLCNK